MRLSLMGRGARERENNDLCEADDVLNGRAAEQDKEKVGRWANRCVCETALDTNSRDRIIDAT